MLDQNAIEAVARGAAWLDKFNPGWEHKIDLGVLDLNNSCRCILGQIVAASVDESMIVYPYSSGDKFIITHLGYATGYDVIMRFVGWDLDFADEHGFTAETPDGYKELDEAWISLIKSRFETGALSDA